MYCRVVELAAKSAISVSFCHCQELAGTSTRHQTGAVLRAAGQGLSPAQSLSRPYHNIKTNVELLPSRKALLCSFPFHVGSQKVNPPFSHWGGNDLQQCWLSRDTQPQQHGMLICLASCQPLEEEPHCSLPWVSPARHSHPACALETLVFLLFLTSCTVLYFHMNLSLDKCV